MSKAEGGKKYWKQEAKAARKAFNSLRSTMGQKNDEILAKDAAISVLNDDLTKMSELLADTERSRQEAGNEVYALREQHDEKCLYKREATSLHAKSNVQGTTILEQSKRIAGLEKLIDERDETINKKIVIILDRDTRVRVLLDAISSVCALRPRVGEDRLREAQKELRAARDWKPTKFTKVEMTS